MNSTVGALVLSTAILVSGCAFQRTNITALSLQQQEYFSALEETLKQNRQHLEDGIELQAKTAWIRRQHLADWELSVKKAEIILAANSSVRNNQKLLSMVLADIELDETTARAGSITDEKAQEILSLYDEIRSNVVALKKNNITIIEYLASKDQEFAIRSLDLEGIITAITGVRELQEQLGRIEKRSDEEKKNERERIQKSIERAQDILLSAFSEESE